MEKVNDEIVARFGNMSRECRAAAVRSLYDAQCLPVIFGNGESFLDKASKLCVRTPGLFELSPQKLESKSDRAGIQKTPVPHVTRCRDSYFTRHTVFVLTIPRPRNDGDILGTFSLEPTTPRKYAAAEMVERGYVRA